MPRYEKLSKKEIIQILSKRVKGGNVWQFIKDIPVGTYRFLTRRNKKLNQLSKDAKLHAKIASQSYPKTTQKDVIDGYRVNFKDDRRKAYIKGNKAK